MKSIYQELSWREEGPLNAGRHLLTSQASSEPRLPHCLHCLWSVPGEHTVVPSFLFCSGGFCSYRDTGLLHLCHSSAPQFSGHLTLSPTRATPALSTWLPKDPARSCSDSPRSRLLPQEGHLPLDTQAHIPCPASLQLVSLACPAPAHSVATAL